MRAPVLATGDGALRFWGAIDEVFPETRHQRDWVHKAANVLDALPASVQPQAKRALAEITNAENKAEAERAVDRFVAEFGARWPKAVDKIVSDRESLLAF
jgi:transposase-like protein